MPITWSNEKTKFLIFLLLISASIFVSFYYDLYDNISVLGLKRFILQMGAFAPAVFILIYICTSLLVFPNLLISMAGGAIWGPYLGTFYTVVGASIGSLLPFLISRKFGRGFLQKITKHSTVGICDRYVSKNGFIAVFIVRLIPFFAWELVNYGSGLCDIRMRDYLLATVLGTIPASFTYNLIGSSLGQPVDKVKIVLIFAMVVLIGAATIAYKMRWENKP